MRERAPEEMGGGGCIYWILIAIAGLGLSVQAGKQYLLQKTSSHFYMMLTFIIFSIGWSYIGYVLRTGKSMDTLEPVWAFITIILGLLLTPVFCKHFYMLVGDRGGFCLEAGFLGMIVGFMLITTQSYQVLPFLGMISLGLLFLGYVRLQELLFRKSSQL
jgi:hypothetical protein